LTPYNDLERTSTFWKSGLCPVAREAGAPEVDDAYATMPKLACLNNTCPECGGRDSVEEVHRKGKFKFTALEMVPEADDANDVIGRKFAVPVQYYEMVVDRVDPVTKLAVKKLALITKTLTPAQIARGVVKHVLKSFPGHQFRALWLHDVYTNLIKNLPFVSPNYWHITVLHIDASLNHADRSSYCPHVRRARLWSSWTSPKTTPYATQETPNPCTSVPTRLPSTLSSSISTQTRTCMGSNPPRRTPSS
jgi:hypothetical protein